MSEENTKNTPDAASTAANGAAQAGQPEGQAQQAQPAADPYQGVLTWDNVPRAAWDYLQQGVQSGAVSKEVVDSWVADATERQRRQVHDYRERGQLLRTIRELAGKRPEQEVVKDPPPALPSLKQALAGVDTLDEAAVEALERVIEARVKAEVQGRVPPTSQQAANVDPQAIERAQEARQGDRLGKRFPVLAAPDNDWVMDEIRDQAKVLVRSDPRYQYVGTTLDERFDRLFDDASAVVLARHPQLRQTAQVQPPAPPAKPAPPPAKDGISGGARPAGEPELTFAQRQVLAANLASRGHKPEDARRAAGLPAY